jgi:hypothetical protein
MAIWPNYILAILTYKIALEPSLTPTNTNTYTNTIFSDIQMTHP